jgi:pilus assembly protein CpaF
MTNSVANLFGPLKKYYENDDTVEIIVNSFDNVYIDAKGKIELIENVFQSKQELEGLVHGIFKEVNRDYHVDRIQHLTLGDGTRLAVVGERLSGSGVCFNLLKQIKNEASWDDLINWKAVTPNAKQTLENIVKENANFLLVGAVGSGKNTMANRIMELVPPEYRTISVERVNEMSIDRPHHVSLTALNNETTNLKPLAEGTKYLRADYLFFGQTEGPELPAMFERMGEGFSVFTVTDGESILEGLQRIEMQYLAQESIYDIELIRRAIASNLNYVIFMTKDKEKGRHLAKIVKIKSYDLGKYELEEIYSA